jgi:hypothetical protein
MKGVVGFTAESSLYPVYNQYAVYQVDQQAEQAVYLASYVDNACFDACYNNCNRDCSGLAGSARSACLRQCQSQADACRRYCTRPDTPPPPPPADCPPLFPSGSGLPIYGNYCGPGHGDSTYQTPPVDAVDAVCMAHDACYDRLGYFNCACDRALIGNMPAAVANTPCATGKAAGTAAYAHFAASPCTCWGLPFFVGNGGIGPC